jgi:hypothetical protein
VFTWTNASQLAAGASKAFHYSTDGQNFSAANSVIARDMCDVCAGLPQGSACDDRNPITQGEHCTAGVCNGGSVAGSLLTCPDAAMSQACAQSVLLQAGAASKSRANDIRSDLTLLGQVPGITSALCSEAQTAIGSQDTDVSRTLVALAMVGEMRTREGEACLSGIMSLPFPTTGTCIGSEYDPNVCSRIAEQDVLAMAQIKAVEGLAFLRNTSGDNAVLDAVAQHPSAAVRGRAIVAFLWNHGNSAAARQAVSARMGSAPTRLLDQFYKESTDTRAGFNAKVATYVSQHPEVRNVQLPRSVDCNLEPTHPICVATDPAAGDGLSPERECSGGLVTDDHGHCVIP